MIMDNLLIYKNVVTVYKRSVEFTEGRYERKKWLDENCNGRYQEVFDMDYYFEDKEDAFMFKMRWG